MNKIFITLTTILLLIPFINCDLETPVEEGQLAEISASFTVWDKDSLERIDDADVSVSAMATLNGSIKSFAEESEETDYSGSAEVVLSEYIDESVGDISGSKPHLEISITRDGYESYTAESYSGAFEWIEEDEKYFSEYSYSVYLDSEN